MKSKRLTNDLKEDIMINIKRYIEKTTSESEIAKEANELQEELNVYINEYANSLYPEDDLKVLEKYKCVGESSNIPLIYDEAHNEFKDDMYGSKISIKTNFKKPLYSRHIEINEVISHFPDVDLKSKVILFYQIKDKLHCEKYDLETAYLSVLRRCKTTKQLIDNHPAFEQFIPDTENQKPYIPEEIMTKINTFEESVAA